MQGLIHQTQTHEHDQCHVNHPLYSDRLADLDSIISIYLEVVPNVDHTVIWVPWVDHVVEVDKALCRVVLVIFVDDPLEDLKENLIRVFKNGSVHVLLIVQ